MFNDRFFVGVENFFQGIDAWIKKPIDAFCRLETAHEDDDTLIADDGSLVTMIRLHGSLSMIAPAEFQSMVERLSQSLTPYMKSSGHGLQVLFDSDSHLAHEVVSHALSPSRITSRNLGLDLDGFLDDWESAVSKWCTVESVLVVAWTRPRVLAPANEKSARKARVKELKQSPVAPDAQIVGRSMPELNDAHHAFKEAVLSGFANAGLVAATVDGHKFLWEIRKRSDSEMTSQDWKAVLPGDNLPQRIPDDAMGTLADLAALMYPRIGEQVFPTGGEDLSQNVIRIGNVLHASIAIKVPPQTVKPFNVLHRKMIAGDTPWRISYFLEGNGLGTIGYKSFLSQILHFTSTTNKKFNGAVESLRQRDLAGETLVRLQMMFSTHVRLDAHGMDESKALIALNRQTAELVAAIQAWGSPEATTMVGDPLLGFSSVLPGLMPSSPAPVAPAPIKDTVSMLPITRPASVWSDGSLLFRTPDGKIMPFEHNSSKQASWIDIGVAPMGGGKSVFLNTYNFGFCFQAGLTRMPWLSIIDVGPSSSGLIALIKNALPEGKKHLAQYRRLRMTDDYSINPFDTPLGCRKPLPSHMSFLVNLVSLLCTELKEDNPQDGIPGIARAAITAAYEEFSPDLNPKPYTTGLDTEVDAALKNLGAHLDQGTSWWEVVDYLFEAGQQHLALRAQRFAMPLLADVASMARRDIVTGVYTHNTRQGERITDFFWRSCVDSISAYPILRKSTQFDIGDAQIISLDLDEVAPRGGAEADRQTGVMYMLARHVTASRFFMMPEDVRLIPDLYKDYHRERIDHIRQDPKRLCYDEVHRISRSSSVAKQIVGDLETSARESRKWNLSIGLYSQSIDDYPDIIVELATSVFILGAGTEEMADRLSAKFGLSKGGRNALLNLGKPGAAGANMLAMFNTSDGRTTQLLTNTIGRQAMWAFSSTTEDVTVRNRIYQHLGVRETLQRLALLYPNGSVKPDAERRKAAMSERGIEDETIDVLTQIVSEVMEYRPEKEDL